MVNEIRMSIPGNIADLIVAKTMQQSYDDMVKNNGLPFIEAMTFGMVITPIINSDSQPVAYVIYWHNKMVSVTRRVAGKEFMPLVSVENWHGSKPPVPDEALDIYHRHTQREAV